MTTQSPIAEKLLWIVFSVLLIVASIMLCLRFWTAAAYADQDLTPHVCIALASQFGYLASLATVVGSLRAAKVPRALLAMLAAAVCFVLNCVGQTGAYAFQEASAIDDRAQVQAVADSSRMQFETAQSDVAATRDALQGQLNALDADIARLQAQSADLAAKGMLSKGVAVIEPQIADARARRENVAAQLASLHTDAPESMPATTQPTAKGRNAFTSFFATLAAFTGRSEEKLRSVFFILLPPVHEFLAGCAMVFLSSLVSVRRVQESEDDEATESAAVLAAKIPKTKGEPNE